MSIIAESPLLAARTLYQNENLDLPFLPAELAPQLRQLGPATFSTRELDWALYDFNRFVAELQSGPVAPYAAFGLGGHGIVSQAAHYYAVSEHCAVLFQLRWGTPMDNPEADRTQHNAVLKLSQKLAVAALQKAQAGEWPTGQRIVVAESTFHGARWGWLPVAGDPAAKLTAVGIGAIANALTAVQKL